MCVSVCLGDFLFVELCGFKFTGSSFPFFLCILINMSLYVCLCVCIHMCVCVCVCVSSLMLAAENMSGIRSS